MRLIEFEVATPFDATPREPMWVNPDHVAAVTSVQVELNSAKFGTRILLSSGAEVVTPQPIEEVVVRLRDEGA